MHLQLGMSVLREYVTAGYFACCHIFLHISIKCAYRIFFLDIGIFDGNFNYFNIICGSI